MDLVDYDQARIRRDRRRLSRLRRADRDRGLDRDPGFGPRRRQCREPQPAMPWYDGPSLLEHLETVPLDAAPMRRKPLRMPVQWVNRPNQDFRGFAGQIAAGRGEAPATRCGCCRPGRTTLARIVTADGDLERGGGGAVGHADLRRRSRLLARRRDRRRRRSAAGRRPVRGDDRMDGRGAAAAGPRLLAEARHPDGPATVHEPK